MKFNLYIKSSKSFKLSAPILYAHATPVHRKYFKMAVPRFITAAEILAEREDLRSEMNSPHGTGRNWSLLWVYCDCPNCRDSYDPTGVESAKYLNMDPTSFYRGQGDKPSFAFSKTTYKDSFLAASKPGFYLDENRLDLPTLLERLTPAHKNILCIKEGNIWEELVQSKDGTSWTRRSYKNGRCVNYKEGENPPMPFEALPTILSQL